MKKLIIFKYLLSYGLCIGVFGALTLTPTISNRVEKVNSFANASNTRAANDVAVTGKINMTLGDKWSTDDFYPLNNGYKFMNGTKATDLYRINNKGLVVNESYPRLETPVSNNRGIKGLRFRNEDRPFYKDGDIWKDGQLTSQSITEWMITANWEIDKGWFPDATIKTTTLGPHLTAYTLSPTRPNLFIKMPLIQFGVEFFELDLPGWPLGRPNPMWDSFNNETAFLDPINGQYGHNLIGEVNPTGETAYGQGAPYVKLLDRYYNPYASARTWEYKMSVFNDYDEKSGKLIATHMFDYQEGKTKLPRLQINEALLNKKYTVDDQDLNIDNLVSFIDYENLPSIAGKDVTVTSNFDAGTMTFKYTPKVYLNGENRLTTPQNDSSYKPITVTISGFSTSITEIKALVKYPQDVIVDKWIEAMKTNNELDVNKLDDYLDLTSVPTGAKYTITLDPDLSKVYNYKTGTIKFKIKSDKYFLPNKTVINSSTNDFDIELKLGKRITNITKKAVEPSKILASEMESKLFSGNQLNVTEFNKYADFIAPVDNTKYYLVPGSYKCNTGDGTVDFAIYPDMYYDAVSQLITNTADNIIKDFKFHFDLKPSTTIIEVNKLATPTHRVDQFIEQITNTDGTIKDLAAFENYVNIEHLPTGSVLTIENVLPLDYGDKDYRDTITFDLKASKSNNDKNVPVKDAVKTLSIKLLPQHKETDAVLKKIVSKPDRVDLFKSKITSLTGVELITYLREYIDFTSLHADANITATIENLDLYQGTLDLNLAIENYYDINSDPNKGIKRFSPIKMELPAVPTAVDVIKPVDKSVRLDRFVKLFADETTGVVNNLSVLQQYVSFSVWDPNTTLTIDLDSITMDNATGDWSGNIIMQEANDTDSSRVTDKSFPLAFNFAEKYDPTEMDKLPQYPLVQMDDFVNNLFHENGIANESIYDYIDVHSLPPDAEIQLIDTKYDYPNAKVSLTLSISKYYDEDSDVQETIKSTRASTGFVRTFSFDLLSPPTNITVHQGYDASVRVDRFAASFKDLTDDALQAALKDYVDFSYLPANVKLSVDQDSFSVIDLPGTLSFNVIASRYFDNEGFLQTLNKPFPITLNLADKNASTSIAAKQNSELPENLIRVDRFITALGASEANPEITNQDVLDDYIDVISLPPNTTLSVDYNEDININPTGELEFSINASQYYDVDSDLQQNLSFPISLMLAPKFDPTIITAKTSNLPNVRADRLLNTFMNNLGLVTDRKVLEEYVDIYSLPPETNLYVSDAKVDNKLGTVNFDLIASHYYDADSDLRTDSLVNKNNPFPIMLQLLPRKDPTDFIAKTVLPEDIIVNNLTNYIAPNNVVNINRLSEYVDIISLPPNTKISIQEVSYSATTGAITYNIDVNNYYDEKGDLHTNGKTYTITLQLSPVNEPTEIYALSAYPDVSDVATFKNYVADADGKAIIENLQKFVGIISLPSKSELTITWGSETDTTIDFIINASQYYNEKHQLAYDKNYQISLALANKFDPTIIKVWDTYPQISVGTFFKKVNPQGMINYGELSKYLDLSTVPYDAKLTISAQNADAKTGVATFTITTSAWYDEANVRHATDKAFAISLNLTPQHAATNLYAITNISKDLTLDDFWTQISSNGALDVNKLANYVNLDTLVPGTKLKYLNPVKTWSGNISFDLEVNQYYDADGLLNFGKKVFKITLPTTATQLNAEKIVDYTWLYITISLVAAILCWTIWFLIFKNKKSKKNARI